VIQIEEIPKLQPKRPAERQERRKSTDRRKSRTKAACERELARLRAALARERSPIAKAMIRLLLLVVGVLTAIATQKLLALVGMDVGDILPK
jgi:hypothetical protein